MEDFVFQPDGYCPHPKTLRTFINHLIPTKPTVTPCLTRGWAICWLSQEKPNPCQARGDEVWDWLKSPRLQPFKLTKRFYYNCHLFTSSASGRNQLNTPPTTTHYDLIFGPARYLCRRVNCLEYHRQVWRRPDFANSYKAIG